MNIAIFTDLYLGMQGGTEVSIANQKHSLEAAGHSVFIVTPGTSYESSVLSLPTIPFLKIDGNRVYLPAPTTARTLTKKLADLQIDVIHIQTEFGVGHLGAAIAKKLSIPVVYTVHTQTWKQIDSNFSFPTVSTLLSIAAISLMSRQRLRLKPALPNESFASRGWRSITFHILQRVDAVITPSSHLASKLSSWGYGNEISVIPNPVADRPMVDSPLPEVPRFLWVGRMSHEKRPLQFIAAVKRVIEQTDIPFSVELCGSGPLASHVKELSADISALQFSGRVSNDEILYKLTQSSMLAITSYNFDNQPVIIAESISQNRGVLYCDPELKEGLDTGAGVLVGHDPESIAEGLLHLIQNPDEIVATSVAAKRVKPLFSSQYFENNVSNLYRRLCK